jgi:hypothetical protein
MMVLKDALDRCNSVGHKGHDGSSFSLKCKVKSFLMARGAKVVEVVLHAFAQGRLVFDPTIFIISTVFACGKFFARPHNRSNGNRVEISGSDLSLSSSQ